MLKKTIKYTDYNGVERKEDFYFHLTKPELIEMQFSTDGGLDEKIRKIFMAQNGRAIMNIFKELILKAYGEKSDDGRRFIKSKELSEAFAQTEAYTELYMELTSSDEAAAEFINGIIPADIEVDQDEAKAMIADMTK